MTMVVRKKWLGGLLKSRPVKEIFKIYIKPSRMYQEVLRDFKEGSATKADKIRVAITGIRAYANALYKQTRQTTKQSKDPLKKEQGKKLLRELADGINRLKKSAAKHKAAEVSTKMDKLGIKKHYKGGLMRKPKLAKRGY